MYTYIHMRINICINIFLLTYTWYVSIHTQIYIYICIDMCTYRHTYQLTQIYISDPRCNGDHIVRASSLDYVWRELSQNWEPFCKPATSNRCWRVPGGYCSGNLLIPGGLVDGIGHWLHRWSEVTRQLVRIGRFYYGK